MTKEDTLTELGIDDGCDEENNAVVSYSDYCYGNYIRNIFKLENTSPILNALVQCHKEWERKHFEESDRISAIKETLGHYYCRTYCEFNGIVNDKNAFDSHCENIFQPMLSMYHHLSKDGDIPRDGDKETEYYQKLLELANQILGTNEAELLTKFSDYSAHRTNKGKNIFLLYSSNSSQQNNHQKTDLTQFMNKLSSLEATSSYICVGDTLYFEKNGSNSRIGAIKIVNTSLQSEPSQQYEYYLVFKWSTGIGDMEIIHKARNLLTMRGLLMRRIVNDFENHLRNEFIMLRDRVKALSIDRSGSHSPFEELKDVFLDTKLKIQESNMGAENEIYARYLKLIADSVISKLYVHSIARTFPAHFHPNDFRIRYDEYDDVIPLDQYQKMFEMLNKFGRCVADSGATKIPSSKSFIDKSLSKRRLISPKKCGYIWCCAFIALYFNALNHGYAEKNTNDEDEVTVEVSCKDNYICFRNRAMDCKDECKSERHLNRVTLEALQYYFDNYYGEKLFKVSTETSGEAKYYTVILPGLAEEEEGDNA